MKIGQGERAHVEARPREYFFGAIKAAEGKRASRIVKLTSQSVKFKAARFMRWRRKLGR
jgi:hypothetical protein